MLGEADLLDIAGGPEVDWREILLDLRIVAGLHPFVVEEKASYLHDTDTQNDDAQSAGQPLADARSFQFSGLLLMGFVRDVLFFCFHILILFYLFVYA